MHAFVTNTRKVSLSSVPISFQGRKRLFTEEMSYSYSVDFGGHRDMAAADRKREPEAICPCQSSRPGQ